LQNLYLHPRHVSSLVTRRGLCPAPSFTCAAVISNLVNPAFIFVPLLALLGVCSIYCMISDLERDCKRCRAVVCLVKPNTYYLNNHLLEGIGYYHAVYKCWFPHPWNEFREGQGYYWNGRWNFDPDSSEAAKSMPGFEEIGRVNALWCSLDPERHRIYLHAVKRFGPGLASGRPRDR
jgi:hypothetical protein